MCILDFRVGVVPPSFQPDLRIDGYPVSAWIEATNDNVRNQLTFYGAKDFRHYANQDTDNPNLSCAVPTSVGHSLVTSSSARISWTASTNNVRFTVRYRASGDQQWEYAPSPGPSTGSYADLSGLSSGTTYSYQVVAGCSQSGEESAVSDWTSAGSFTTP